MIPSRHRTSILIGLVLACACSNPSGSDATIVEAATNGDPADRDAVMDYIEEPWTGDLDGIVERGFLRILTVHNPLFFTFEGGEQHGITVEMSRLFSDHLDEKIGQVRSPTVVLIPVARDELLTGLAEGRGDIAAANLSITDGRTERVAFSEPIYPDIDELVVTGPAAPEISSLDDLVKTELYVRPSSSYWEHLESLNAARARAGEKPIPVRAADENLEDHDLLDLVHAGVFPAIVVDSHKLEFWASVFPDVTVHHDVAIHRGAKVGWAVRKDSPELLRVVDEYARKVRKGTLLGNIVLRRYRAGAEVLDAAVTDEHRERFDGLADSFRRYASEYGFDWHMIAAQGYQESRFDPNKRSPAGAVGVMQLLPSTAADPNVGIEDISSTDDNIHAGVRYMRFLRDRYFSDDDILPLDRVLFSLAAYNAGPANVARARRRAEALGFDPDRWFGHVEVGMYRAVSGEPVSYVRNVYKYYVTFLRLDEARRARERALREASG